MHCRNPEVCVTCHVLFIVGLRFPTERCSTWTTKLTMEGSDTFLKKVKHELSLFAAKRGITKYAIKIRTVTSSVDAALNNSVSGTLTFNDG